MKATNGFNIWAAAASETANGGIVMDTIGECTHYNDVKASIEGDVACIIQNINGDTYISPTEVIETPREYELLFCLSDYCDAEISGSNLNGRAAKMYDNNREDNLI